MKRSRANWPLIGTVALNFVIWMVLLGLAALMF
jgi:hypothetical protein